VLDLTAIREDPEPFRHALARRSSALVEDVDRALDLDRERRELTQQVEEQRARQNRGSKAVGSASGEERECMAGRTVRTMASGRRPRP
jgi:seryl-tRNA synthetase